MVNGSAISAAIEVPVNCRCQFGNRAIDEEQWLATIDSIGVRYKTRLP